MSGFDLLGKLFDLNRGLDNRLANKAFKRANDPREKEIKAFPASFRMGDYAYDRASGAVRCSFDQCPNAEFARRYHLEAVLPLMRSCDCLAIRKLHVMLIREGTCGSSKRCDYCIVGDRNPLAANYENVKNEQGLIIGKKIDSIRSRK